ncbi:MAG: PIG-L family deacetylase [Acidobacteriales bacterium]|nr:PIG-L family deacetylase [Terriglobales bacterium]
MIERHANIDAKRLAQAFGTTIVLLPHHDDECAAGALLHELRGHAKVVFLTDSAPADPYFWQEYGSREKYRTLRQQESLATLGNLGVTVQFAATSAADQQLHLHLRHTLATCISAAKEWRAKTVLAPAYEGGHPDHDSASWLASAVARAIGAQHWELPYYHLTRSGKYRQQRFLPHPTAPVEWHLSISPTEAERKRAMWSAYESQCRVLREFAIERESYRRAPAYDYTRAPHDGLLNYEAWGWPVTGRDLLRTFAEAQEPHTANYAVA